MLQTPAKAENFILKNVNVLDGKGNKIPQTNVVVEKGRITRISHTLEGLNTDDTHPIDMGNRWLMPGLIDMHVHLCAETGTKKSGAPPAYWRMKTLPGLKAFHAARNAQVTMMAGFTTLRNCGHVTYYEPEDVILRDAISQGLIQGPRIVASAGSITMTSGHGDLAISGTFHRIPELRYGEKCFDGVAECIKGTREKIRAGADFIKIMTSGGLSSGGDEPEWPNHRVDEIQAIVYEAKSFNKKVASHAQGRSGIERAVAAGVDTIEHGCSLNEELCEVMVKKGIFLVPTVKVVRALAASKDDMVREKAERLVKSHNDSIKMAAKFGVKIAYGTDTFNSLKPGDNAQDLLYLSELGLSNDDLIKCITATAAEALGMEDSIGSIREGMMADLIVVDRDPSQDISVLTQPDNIKVIVVRGSIVKMDL